MIARYGFGNFVYVTGQFEADTVNDGKKVTLIYVVAGKGFLMYSLGPKKLKGLQKGDILYPKIIRDGQTSVSNTLLELQTQ